MTDDAKKTSFTPHQTRPAHCDKHGEFIEECFWTRGVERWAGCGTCRSEAMDAQRADRIRKPVESPEEALEKLVRATRIPRRFRTRSLENYRADTPEKQKALDVARDYAKGFRAYRQAGICVLFLGNCGTGKTHLACGMALAIASQGFSVRYSDFEDLLLDVRESWRPSAEKSTGQVMRELVDPDLLIIDEVGVSGGTDDEKRQTFRVVNERYKAEKPTMMISNLNKADFAAFVGERVMDRLKEGGRGHVFKWASERPKVEFSFLD